ncbi:MAG: DEAD/DEAH box helicase [Candidatus Bathyarchaeia archaeon]
MKNFQALEKSIEETLEEEGILEFSEIQNLAISKIIAGENLLIIAPTGSGKTYAAIVPIFSMFLNAKKRGETKGISILYITPLRALNRDLLRRLSQIGNNLGINVQVRHGDTLESVRALQARFPPEMLITTPETLQAILLGKRMKEHLKGVRWVIVDEIHELVTDKRGNQLSLALERLQTIAEKEFQRIGLSATIGDEELVANFLVGCGRKVSIVKSRKSKDFSMRIEYPTPKDEDYERAKELSVPPTTVSRVRRILELVSEYTSSLIFTNTREQAEAIGFQIHALKASYPVRVHHGSLSREIREEVEKEFQKGLIKGVVCTSSLELGIDIGAVDFVIQYTSPRQVTRLIQRVGRSEHRLHGIPKGCIITNLADDILESFVIVKHAKQERLEKIKIHENALDVLAHQVVGLALDLKRIELEKIYQTVKKAYPYRNLELESLYLVLNQLSGLNLIKVYGKEIRPRYPEAFKYYYENLSVIPDVKRYNVFDFINKRMIGSLDQEFVNRKCKPGTEFIMHGFTWRIISVDDEEYKIEVEPVPPTLNAIPSWEGEIIPVDYEVAIEVGKLRKLFLEEKIEKDREIKFDEMDTEAFTEIKKTIKTHARSYPLPTDERIVIENFENCIILHACFGNLVNETLGIILSALLSSRHGVSINTQVDPYRIAFVFPYKMSPRIVLDELNRLNPDELDRILEGLIEDTDLFAWKFWHVARRFGAVKKEASYKINRARLLIKIFKDSPIINEARREIFVEKLDLERTKQIMNRIAKKEISIEVMKEKNECSPLAFPIVDKIVPYDLLKPALSNKFLVEIVKGRLLSTNVKLICLFNADWESIRSIDSLKERIKCPLCGSTLIAMTYPNDEELMKILKKRKSKKSLSKDEEPIWNKAWKSAGLVQNYGKKAIIAMAGRGIGPTMAVRILRKPYRSEEEFYVEILKAEREFARTRLFWK